MNKRIIEMIEESNEIEAKLTALINEEMKTFFEYNGFKFDTIDVSIHDNKCYLRLASSRLNEVYKLHLKIDQNIDELKEKFPEFLNRE